MPDQPEDVLDERIGPFYDDAGLRAHFGFTSAVVDGLVRSSDVLLVGSSDGERLYPSFQFGADGAPLPGLRIVLDALDPEREDPWGDAAWLNAPAEELGGTTPAQALLSNRMGETMRLAEQAGAFRLG